MPIFQPDRIIRKRILRAAKLPSHILPHPPSLK